MSEEKTFLFGGKTVKVRIDGELWYFQAGDIVVCDQPGPWQNQYVQIQGHTSLPHRLWGLQRDSVDPTYVENAQGIWLFLRPSYPFCVGDIVRCVSDEIAGLAGCQGRVVAIDPRDLGDSYFLIEFPNWQGTETFEISEPWIPSRERRRAKNRVWFNSGKLELVKSVRQTPLQTEAKNTPAVQPVVVPQRLAPPAFKSVSSSLWGFRVGDVITLDTSVNSPWVGKKVQVVGCEDNRLYGRVIGDPEGKIKFATNPYRLILLQRHGFHSGVGSIVRSNDPKSLHYGYTGSVVAIDPHDQQLLVDFDSYLNGCDCQLWLDKPWFPESCRQQSMSRAWCQISMLAPITEFFDGPAAENKPLVSQEELGGAEEVITGELAGGSVANGGQDWLSQLLRSNQAVTSHVYVLHGNVNDYQRRAKNRYLNLPEFLANLFQQRQLVMFYDLNRGLTFATEVMEVVFRNKYLNMGESKSAPMSAAERAARKVQKAQNELTLEEIIGKSPDKVFPLLDQVFSGNSVPTKPEPAVLVIDFAHHLLPSSANPSPLEKQLAEMMLQWARNRRMRSIGHLVILITPQLGGLTAELKADDSQIEVIRLPKPDEFQRQEFFQCCRLKYDLAPVDGLDEAVLARLTNGLSLVQLENLCQQARRGQIVLDVETVKNQKQKMLETDFGSRLKVKVPKWGFDLFGGRAEVKRYLLEVRDNINRGILRRVPMGLLASGPPGTGKTFIFECWSKECGFNFVEISNPRNMWVGESERWLQEIFGMLDDLAPVIVVEDEADQSEASRDAPNGDSGVSNRLRQMKFMFCSDPKRRGRVIWVRLTNRDDLLDAAYKRKGRSDEKIPFLLPDAPEYAEIFRVMFARYEIPTVISNFNPFGEEVAGKIYCAGADVEWMALEADRYAAREGRGKVEQIDLLRAIRDWELDLDPNEVDLQMLLAIKGSSVSLRPNNWQALQQAAKQRIDQRAGLRQPSIYPGLAGNVADTGGQEQTEPLREQ